MKQLFKLGLRKCYSCKIIFPLSKDFFPVHSPKLVGLHFDGFSYQCKKCLLKEKRARHKPLRLRFEVLKKFGFTCQYCGRKAPEVALHIDHIIPKVKGGENNANNLTVACRDCNLGKYDVLLENKNPLVSV